jgi:hypothetical protein
MRNCKAKRLVGPYGSWSREELIGAHVRISSMPVSNFAGGFDCHQTFTIKDIIFRISTEGKTITVIILDQYPDYSFTWKDSADLKVSHRIWIQIGRHSLKTAARIRNILRIGL